MNTLVVAVLFMTNKMEHSCSNTDIRIYFSGRYPRVQFLGCTVEIYIHTHTCIYECVCVYIVCISSDSHKSCMRVQFSPHLPQFLVGSVLFILVTLRGV